MTAEQLPHDLAKGGLDGPAAPPEAMVTPVASSPAVTPEQIAIVKSTVPVLREHGVAITTVFYNDLLNDFPMLKNIFNATSQATGAQPRALASAVLLYATYIDDLGKLQHAVERIAHKHASLQIQPEQYAIVGKCLMKAIGTVLGEAATPVVVDAWTAAYAVLASVFVVREKALYDEARQHDGGNGSGWVGWRSFFIAHREPANASGDILSLYLKPVDGRALPSYLPGQYVSLQLFVPELGVLQGRQYSLSRAAKPGGDAYRICVKRNTGHGGTTVPGRISNLLHGSLHEGDQVELSQPQGEYVFEPQKHGDAPVVLISAGVGVTPSLAILETVAGKTSVPISWMHASHSYTSLPLFDEVRALRSAHPGRIKTFIALTEIGEAEERNLPSISGDVFVTGTHLSLTGLSDSERTDFLFTANIQTIYYVCGPSGFMKEAQSALKSFGVSVDRIYMELFDTGDL